MLNNIFFYLPMGYLLKTRLNSLAKFISWNIIYVFPLFYLAYIKLNFVITIIDFVEILGSIIVVYNFYEIGYIQNDTETIKRESNPTLRVSKDELEYYEENIEIMKQKIEELKSNKDFSYNMGSNSGSKSRLQKKVNIALKVFGPKEE